MFTKSIIALILIVYCYAQTEVKNNLEDYKGNYQFEKFSIEVFIENDSLLLLPSGKSQKKFPIFSKTKTHFFTKINDAIIYFERNKKGNIFYMLWVQGGHTYRGKKNNE